MNLLAFVLFLAAQQQLSQTIVVTASELPETLESTPASVTVITKSDIDARGRGANLNVAAHVREAEHIGLNGPRPRTHPGELKRAAFIGERAQYALTLRRRDGRAGYRLPARSYNSCLSERHPGQSNTQHDQR